MNAFDLMRRLQAQRTGAVANVLGAATAAPAPVPPPTPTPAPGKRSAMDLVLKAKDIPKEEKPPTEADRILALPEWSPDSFSIDLTSEFRRPGGTMSLKPIQSAALYWVGQQHGLLGALAVGSGKTLISLLAPRAMGAKRPLLLLPVTMQIPLRREMMKLADHWYLPDERTFHVVPYSQLSVAGSTGLLEELRPDLIIADECHMLRHDTSARTKRVLRYAQQFPTTKFVFLSGTVTSRGLRDYAHLAELALKDGTPLPRDAQDLLAWSACLDADGRPRNVDWDFFARFHDVRDYEETEEKQNAARARFQARLTRTPGVVASTEGSVGASLILRHRPLQLPSEVCDALEKLRNTWCRPDGEELVSALDYWRCSTQMAQGFYYYWDWPKDENGTPVVDTEWLAARSRWHKCVRDVLKANVVGMDSPLLVYRAVQSGVIQGAYARGAFDAWNKVRDRKKPPTATVWLSDFIVDDVLAWMAEHPKGLVWQSDRALELAFRERGVRVFGPGTVPPEDGEGMVLSVDVHGAGLNLQNHHENLVLNFPGSGKTCEQLFGRTHRFGQAADEVWVDYYAETAEAWGAIEKAKADARYIEDTMRSPQKLLYATWIDDGALLSY